MWWGWEVPPYFFAKPTSWVRWTSWSPLTRRYQRRSCGRPCTPTVWLSSSTWPPTFVAPRLWWPLATFLWRWWDRGWVCMAGCRHWGYRMRKSRALCEIWPGTAYTQQPRGVGKGPTKVCYSCRMRLACGRRSGRTRGPWRRRCRRRRPGCSWLSPMRTRLRRCYRRPRCLRVCETHLHQRRRSIKR